MSRKLMFVTDVSKLSNILPRMTITHLRPTPYIFIRIKPYIDYRNILLYEDGILYTSYNNYMFGNLKNTIEKDTSKLLGTMKDVDHKKPVLILYLNGELSPICYTDSSGKFRYFVNDIVHITNTTGLIGAYIVYSYYDDELYFLNREVYNDIRLYLQFFNSHNNFHRPLNITDTGLLLALELISNKFNITAPKNDLIYQLKNQISRIERLYLFGHKGLGKEVNEEMLYNLIFGDIVNDNEEIKLSVIIENPETILSVTDAIQVNMDVSIGETINDYGLIEEMYVEQGVLNIIIIPAINTEYTVDEEIEIIRKEINKLLDNVNHRIIFRKDSDVS
jgi:hypothetical protein